MNRKPLPAEQIVSVFTQAELGVALGDIAWQPGISKQTSYRPKQQYDGMRSECVRELKILLDENARLKKPVAERMQARQANEVGYGLCGRPARGPRMSSLRSTASL